MINSKPPEREDLSVRIARNLSIGFMVVVAGYSLSNCNQTYQHQIKPAFESVKSFAEKNQSTFTRINPSDYKPPFIVRYDKNHASCTDKK